MYYTLIILSYLLLINNAKPADTCDAQAPCLNLKEMTVVDKGDGLKYRVCIEWDSENPGCDKSDTISHSCPTSYEKDKIEGWRKKDAMCKTVKCGTKAKFGIKDGKGCQKTKKMDALSLGGKKKNIQCYFEGGYCGGGARKDCTWSIPVPQCPTEPPQVCEGDMVYNECGSTCTKTCDNPTVPCILVCTPRCECPKDKAILADENTGRCITLDECPVCKGENPAGCKGTGPACPDGEECVFGGCSPSLCSCTESGWICTKDCGGGQCVPTDVECEEPNPAGCTVTGCADGEKCDTTVGCKPSVCSCTENGWICTKDCGGGECVLGVKGTCNVDGKIYQDGEVIDHIGRTCTGDATYNGDQSICVKGEVIDAPYQGDCSTQGPGFKCCQEGPEREKAAAVCAANCALDCSLVLCLKPVCNDNEELYTPQGACCPQCRCNEVAPCLIPPCPCKPPDCSAVLCAQSICGDNEEEYTPDGYCCSRCRPKTPICPLTKCVDPCKPCGVMPEGTTCDIETIIDPKTGCKLCPELVKDGCPSCGIPDGTYRPKDCNTLPSPCDMDMGENKVNDDCGCYCEPLSVYAHSIGLNEIVGTDGLSKSQFLMLNVAVSVITCLLIIACCLTSYYVLTKCNENKKYELVFDDEDQDEKI